MCRSQADGAVGYTSATFHCQIRAAARRGRPSSLKRVRKSCPTASAAEEARYYIREHALPSALISAAGTVDLSLAKRSESFSERRTTKRAGALLL